MPISIADAIVRQWPEQTEQEAMASNRSGLLQDQLKAISVSEKQAVWLRKGARLRRAAQFREPSSSVSVMPLRRTTSELLLVAVNASGAIASHAQALIKPPRSTDLAGPGSALISDVTVTSAPTTIAQSLAYRALTASMPASDVRPLIRARLSDAAALRMQYLSVFGFMEEMGYTFSETVVSRLRVQLFKAVVQLLMKDRDLTQQLVRKLLHDLGYYGGRLDQAISSEYQNKMYRDWMSQLIFGRSLDDFIVDHLDKREETSPFTNADLRQLIRHEIYRSVIRTDKVTDHDWYENDASVKDWIWRHIVVEELPLLDLPAAAAVESLALTNVAWGKMHAALRFSLRMGIDPATLSQDEAQDMGSLLLASLEVSAIPPEWGGHFSLPARCYHALTSQKKSDESDLAALAGHLAHYFEQAYKVMAEVCPLSNFQRQITAFKTRHQIAQELIDMHCPGKDPATLLDFGEGWCIDTPAVLTDTIIHRYRQQIDDIGAAYAELDKLLLAAAWGALDEKALEFISDAMVQRLSIKFSAVQNFKPVVTFGGSPVIPESLTIHPMKNVDFYAFNHAGKERIYAISRGPDQYQIVRVDRNREDYVDFMSSSRMRNDTDFNLVLRYGIPLEKKPEMLKVLFDDLVQHHKNRFSKELYEFGFQQTTLEKIKSLLLSFILFYDCINEARQGNEGAAAVACTVDGIALLPLLGQLSRMSIKVGQAIYKGGLMSIRKATGEMAARHALHAVVREGVKDFVWYGMLPARDAIGPKHWKSLALAVARSLDPGVELIGLVGTKAAKQFNVLGKRMAEHLPGLRHALSHIQKSATEVSRDMRTTVYTTARLPGIDHDLSVVRLTGETVRGNPLYVQIDPISGQRYGLKYMMTTDGILKPARVDLSLRYQRYLAQGLGGKGAIEAGQRLAEPASLHWQEFPSSISPGKKFSLDVSKIGMVERAVNLGNSGIMAQGGLEQFARKHDVSYAWLRNYFGINGQLTAAGNDFLMAYQMGKWMALSDQQRFHLLRNGFTADQHFLPGPWQQHIYANGQLNASGYDLLARLESGRSLPEPTRELLEQWINAPALGRSRDEMISFAVLNGVSPEKFIACFEDARYPSLYGEKILYSAKPLRITAASEQAQSLVPLADAGDLAAPDSIAGNSQTVRAGVSTEMHRSFPEMDVSSDQEMRNLLEKVRVNLLEWTAQRSLESTYEHLKLWQDMDDNVRGYWSMAEFCRMLKIEPAVFRTRINTSGILLNNGVQLQRKSLGEIVSRDESLMLTPDLLQAISSEWIDKGPDALSAAGGIADLARARQINQGLLIRYLNADATLTENAHRWMKLIAVERQQRPQKKLNERSITKGIYDVITYEHLKVWHDMEQTQRRLWQSARFARALGLSENSWPLHINALGSMTRVGGYLERDVFGSVLTGERFEVKELLKLQPQAGAEIIKAGGLLQFGVKHGLDMATVTHYFNVDGSFTHSGRRLRNLFALSQLTPDQIMAQGVPGVIAYEPPPELMEAPLSATVSAVPMSGNQAIFADSPQSSGQQLPQDVTPFSALMARQQSPVVAVLNSVAASGNAGVAVSTNRGDDAGGLSEQAAGTSYYRQFEGAPLFYAPPPQSRISMVKKADEASDTASRHVLLGGSGASAGAAEADAFSSTVSDVLSIDMVRFRQFRAIDNGLPTLQQADDRYLSILEQVEGPIDRLAVTNWNELQTIFDAMPTAAVEIVKARVLDAVCEWLRRDGQHAAMLESRLRVNLGSSDSTENTLSIIATCQIERFTVIGAVAGAYLADLDALGREMEVYGEDNVFAFLYGGENLDSNLSAYGRSNILSLINMGRLSDRDSDFIVILGEENLVPIRVGNSLTFLVALRDIRAGEELLMSRGDLAGLGS